jgi:hypothetical protein
MILTVLSKRVGGDYKMGIYLGNLSVDEIEYRTGVTFSDEIKTRLKATRQETPKNISETEWHCFDIPFMMACGSIEFAQEIYKMLEPYEGRFKVPMHIGTTK